MTSDINTLIDQELNQLFLKSPYKRTFWNQIERPTKAVPKIAIKPIFKKYSIFLLRNPYRLQIKHKINKDGIYEASLVVKESIRIPIAIPTIEDLQGRFLSEKGNNKITGQHGVIPFSLSQSGDMITKAGKQIIKKKVNNFLLYLTIIF